MMRDASWQRKGELHHASGYAFCMETPAERLRAARVKAGYETAKSAAEAMGVTVSTYIQHESGVRGFPASRAARYARFLRVAPEWLLYGRGTGDPIKVEPELTDLPLIGPLQAGAWLMIDDTPQDEPPTLTAARYRRRWRSATNPLGSHNDRGTGGGQVTALPESTRQSPSNMGCVGQELLISPYDFVGLGFGHGDAPMPVR